VTDEIALNPATFSARTPEAILSTLVHEMAHLWQHHFGDRPRRCYHDRQWASKMRTVGLIPSDTGEPGGKPTGQRMTHYIEPGGVFARSCAAFLADAPPVLYTDVVCPEEDKQRRARAASKTKFSCPVCEANAWAKPDAKLICGECHEPMAPPAGQGGGDED
jgi:hypothetical protein